MTTNNAEKEKRAFRKTLAAAENGQPKEQFTVGLMYANGVGVDQNFEQALHWYTKAANGVLVAVLVLKISQDLLREQALRHARGVALAAAEIVSSGGDRNQRILDRHEKDSGLTAWSLYSPRGEVLSGTRPGQSEATEVQRIAENPEPALSWQDQSIKALVPVFRDGYFFMLSPEDPAEARCSSVS